MGGNFLEMLERTGPTEKGPIEKGPIVSRHCSPLFSCSITGIYRSMHVLFSSQVLVLLKAGQLIPSKVFQSVSTCT